VLDIAVSRAIHVSKSRRQVFTKEPGLNDEKTGVNPEWCHRTVITRALANHESVGRWEAGQRLSKVF
jgi:hypothetical protein